MKLTLGFSPCPNDTYIFDALVHGKVDTEGLEFDYLMADVEQLNVNAFNEIPDVTKLSFHAFMHLAKYYLLLDSGAALGFGTGPLLISKKLIQMEQLEGKTIAIPGIYTSANLLFSLAITGRIEKKIMLFSEIEKSILSGEADAGVIIHENRFTYESKGLRKLLDLGEFWEHLTGFPVPLGGIVAHKRLGSEIIEKVQRSLRRSVEYAFLHKGEISEFVRCNAQEMDVAVMQQHIDLYVNDFSLSLGELGKKAINKMFELALKSNIINEIPLQIYAAHL